MSETAAPEQGNTCAILVTHHPDEGFPDRVRCVSDQFQLVIVVDNGSLSTSLDMLRSLAISPHIRLIENPVNLGIATALNQAVRLAGNLGYKWVFTLDQDTQILSDLLVILRTVYENSGKHKVMIGSNYWNANKQKNLVRCAGNAGFMERKTLITSGSLIAVSMFDDVGFFRDDYFIDSVDHEFCLRARGHGWRMLITCKPVMSQYIGSNMQSASLMRRLMAFNHPPERKYFIARNTVVTVRAYFWQEPAWCMWQGLRLLSDVSAILLFEKNKMKKLRAFVVGIVHGVRDRMGPMGK